MIGLESILVVDPSGVMRQVLEKVLAAHVTRVQTACNFAEALVAIENVPGMVMCAEQLPDGDAWQLFEEVAGQAPPVCFAVLASKWIEASAERAKTVGAAGYLPKPVSMADITSVWSSFRRFVRDERVSLRARVQLVEANGERLFSWRVRNLSASGAFIETRGPLPVGEQLELEIQSGSQRYRVRAEVVRLQEPSWLSPGGVGVRFEDEGAEQRAVLESLVGQVRRAEAMIASALEDRD